MSLTLDWAAEPFRGPLFFDIDDTLLNHTLAEELAAGAFFDKYRSFLNSVTGQEFSIDWRTASDRYMEQFLSGRVNFTEHRRLRCQEVMGRAMTGEEANLIFSDYLEVYEANWKVFDDVHNGLKALKDRGVSMGVISNGNGKQQTMKLERMNLLQYFGQIIISESLGVSKPDKQIFEAAATSMGWKTSECIHVGDSIETDVRGAVEAGMRSIWLNRRGLESPDWKGLPIVQVENFSEIIRLIDVVRPAKDH